MPNGPEMYNASELHINSMYPLRKTGNAAVYPAALPAGSDTGYL